MKFNDISVDRFGILKKSGLEDLSSGLTVVYGDNGSGKTTLVSFIRGVLFGYTTDHQGFQPADQPFGGALTASSGTQSFRMTRESAHGVSSDLSVVEIATGTRVPSSSARLPHWVNETVYKEIFSVGYQEAARFDLLTRLCLDGSGTVGNREEIRKAELAIEQSVREREGNGIEGGLRRRRSDLTRQRAELQAQLEDLRTVSPEIPARIRELESRLVQLRTSLSSTTRSIAEVKAEILRLQNLLEELRRRNTLALERTPIEGRISELSQRQQRWEQIRQSVQRELSDLGGHSASPGQSSDSLKTLRALVARLEQRMESVLPQRSIDLGGAEFHQSRFVEHLRSEVAALCDYLSQHESSVASSETALESLLAQRTLHDAENVSTVLQGQIDVLRDELSRSDDVLSADVRQTLGCHASVHREDASGARMDLNGKTIEDLERELQALQSRLHHLQSEERNVAEQILLLEHELSELKSQLKSAARLEDIDRLKSKIAEVDTQLKLVDDRWLTLETTESHLRSLIERLSARRESEVLRLASEYINDLTDGSCYALIADSDNTRILANTRQSATPHGLQQLSRGTRDLVALALRIALIECRAKDTERCPLILDDVFVSADDDGANAAADLLIRVAEGGQQIIFFTCQKDVRELFARRHVAIRTLGQDTPAPAITITPTVFVSEPQPEPVKLIQPTPEPVRTTVPPEDHTNWLFYLEVDSPVEDLSGLTVAELEAFRAADIQNVDTILTMSVDDLETRFRDRGYAISRERIRSWRGQAELATRIPMLRRSDAELLYAAGIQSTVELSRMRPETVYDLVYQFQDTQAGSRFRRSGRGIDRQQAINWSRWSQHSRTLGDARNARSRFFVRTSDSRHSSSRSSGAERSPRQRRSARISQTGSTSRRQRRPRMSQEARRQRDQRLARRRQRMSRRASSYRTAEQTSSVEETRERKFYLNRSDDVEAAPSIGPKTAQRLAKAGVYTVDDLLSGRSEVIAQKLNNKRINADTILQWQNQARLICQIPDLRGHDAQILVACGITEAEQLSGKRPADLYAIVGPFADTSEGERIVRGGRKPDLEEVTDWISFAQHSRPLKAAA